jgi:beta-lactamase class A
MRNIALAGAAVLLASTVALPDTDAGPDVTRLWEMKQLARIKAVDDALDGVLGVATIDLTSGRVFAYNADAVFPTASSIKIPIMIQVFRDEKAGKFSFADKVTLGPKDNAGGSGGPLQKALDKGSVTVTVRDLLEDMIQYSDNSATNRLIDMVGMDRVNALIGEFGLVRTRLRRKMMDTAAAARGDENVSTPLEMTRIVRLIHNNQAADAQSCREMLGIMKKVDAYMRPVIQADVEVASKPGDLDGVRTETGVVFLPKRPFIVSVMSTYLNDRVNPVGQVTGIVFDYFNKLARSNQYGRRLD